MKRLRELRRQQERTQAELSKLLGINRTAISKLEFGQQEASATQLMKLAQYFNVSVDFLLGCETVEDTNGSFDLLKILQSDKVFIGNHQITAEEKKIFTEVTKAFFCKYIEES